MDARTTELATPALPIDDHVVRERAQALLWRCTESHELRQVEVSFLTPTRLISEGHLSAAPHFSVLMRRILRRISDLAQSTNAFVDTTAFEQLATRAENVRIVNSNTRWIDLNSLSKRKGAVTPIGGLVGETLYEGDLSPFLVWLLWSEMTHIGKDATKGNGLSMIAIP